MIVAPTAPRVSAFTKCYRCQGYGHVAAKCGIEIKIVFIDGIPSELTPRSLHKPDPHEDEDFDYDQEGSSVECNSTRLAPSNCISIVKCAFSQYEKNDWRTAIFHKFTKIRGNKWKVMVDSETCVNAVSSNIIEKIGLKVEPHPHPYKVSWINSMTQDVKQ